MSTAAAVQHIQLDSNQLSIANQIIEGMLSGWMETTLAGYAGCGKTVLASYIINELEKTYHKRVLTLCPTGKGANVLRTKGRKAETIHSAIYVYKGVWTDDQDREHISWDKQGALDVKPDFIVVDESSMVTGKIYKDLKSFGVPIIFVGDHGQLPPVVGPGDFDPGLMKDPSFVLEKVYRNGGAILDYATDCRNGKFWKSHFSQDLKILSIHKDTNRHVIYNYMSDEVRTQVIAATNKSRVWFNRDYRQYKSIPGQISVGERLICLHNNRKEGIFNGVQMTVLKKHQGKENDTYCYADVLTDCGKRRTINLYKKTLYKERMTAEDKEKMSSTIIAVDYAYCITCHKSQGSEWDRTIVMDWPGMRFNRKRWLYTAATRAQQELIIINR